MKGIDATKFTDSEWHEIVDAIAFKDAQMNQPNGSPLWKKCNNIRKVLDGGIWMVYNTEE